MAVDIATFRANFPEFANVTPYPDSAVTYWLSIAGLMLNASRFLTLLDLATQLFIAHNLVLEARAKGIAAKGGLPGIQTGAISNKAVDKVSMGYDASAGLELDGGHWNLTEYGTRFLNLARMAGMGGVQVTGGCDFIPGGFFEGW